MTFKAAMKLNNRSRQKWFRILAFGGVLVYAWCRLSVESKAVKRELSSLKDLNAPTIEEKVENPAEAIIQSTIVTKHDDNDLQPSTQERPVPGQSSKHATVMGMAKGYGHRDYKKFVGSLRATGFEGTIILIIAPMEEMDHKAVEYMRQQNVTMKHLQPTNCTYAPKFLLNKAPKDRQGGDEERITCGHPYPELKLRWGRFALLRDHLEACKECTGPALITDVRDTFFQRDPFGPDAPPVKGLHLFQEDPKQRTTHFVTKGPIQKCKKRKVFDRTMLCSGTTIGTRETMLLYLGAMVNEMREWLKYPQCNHPGNGDDQAIHNYLYYTGKLDFIPGLVSVPNGQGLVHTVGTFGSQALVEKRESFATKFNITKRDAQKTPYTTEEDEASGDWLGKDWNPTMTAQYQLTDQQGYFINSNGERSFVIHQYDRFGTPLERWLLNSGPCKNILF